MTLPRSCAQGALVLLGFLAAACGGEEERPSTPATPPSVRVAAAPAEAAPDAPGRVHGRALFEGIPPVLKPLATGSAAGCEHAPGAAPMQEHVVVEDGRLANVFVYVSAGLDGWTPPPDPDAPVVVDQVGCIYTPHVSGLRAGQRLHVHNSDAVAHNVHVRAQRNPGSNRAQPPGAAPLELLFPEPEVAVELVCDYHPWMKAFVAVVEHPFFTVSGSDGAFEIDGLPPGRYTLTAWHERLGRRRVDFELPPGGSAEAIFPFGPAGE